MNSTSSEASLGKWLTEEQCLNQKAFERLQQETQSQPEQWPAGQYVGILRGQVVAASFDFWEVVNTLRQAEPDRRKGMIFQIGDRYSETERMM